MHSISSNNVEGSYEVMPPKVFPLSHVLLPAVCNKNMVALGTCEVSGTQPLVLPQKHVNMYNKFWYEQLIEKCTFLTETRHE
jgi:hypothetical protein